MEGVRIMSVTKVTINLPTNLVERLKLESKLSNCSITETFCSLCQMSVFLFEEQQLGSKLLVQRTSGQTALVHLL